MTPDSSQAPLASGVRSLLIGAGALGAIVAVSVATATLFHARPSWPGAHLPTGAAASRAGLGLRAEVRGGSLQVSWNHDAATVRNATSGSLTFQDGETRKTLQLSQTTARAGTVFYAARGTQVQVALTIFAPDHVVSESISAAVPAAAARSDLPAGEAGAEVLVPSRDREVSVGSPETQRPTQTGQTGASAQHPGLREPDRVSQPVSPEHGVVPGSSAPPIDLHEEPAAAGAVVPEVAAPGSTPKLPPGTVAVRVYVDEKGKVVEAVLVPQHDVNPAFAEAALEMARDWRFDASPAGNQRQTHVLEFRQSANR